MTPFVYETTVRFSQVDPAQVVYFARMYEMAHEAFEELMNAAGLPLGPLFENSDWGMPLVHTEARYRRPWRLGEVVRIEGRVIKLSERSVQFEYSFVDANKQIRTTVGMRHAFVSLKSFEPQSVPESFRLAMQGLGLIH